MWCLGKSGASGDAVAGSRGAVCSGGGSAGGDDSVS